MVEAQRPPADASSLPRRLGLLDAMALLVGIILGSGIFVAPAAVAAAAPGAFGVLVWTLGGIVALCGGLCYAECGARLPRAGGFFAFYREAYGEPLAFVAGWTALLVTYPASTAAIAYVLADYLPEVWPAAGGAKTLVAFLAVLAAGALNVLGVRAGANAQRLLSSTKVAALLTLCVAAALAAPGGIEAALVPATRSAAWPAGAAILTAMVVVFWTYDGWSDVTLVAGEVKDPARNLGRAVLMGVVLLVVLYALVQLAVVTLLPAERAAASTRVVAEAVEAGLGPSAGSLVALLVVVSTAGAINAIILTGSRIGYAMARAGAFYASLGAVDERRRNPTRAVLALTGATLVYVLVGEFRSLMAFFTFAVWIFYALTAVALLRLRRRGVGEPLAWRAPLGPLPPVVMMLTAAFMTVGLFRDDPRRSLIGLAILAAGFPAHALWRRAHRRRGAAAPT